MLRKDRNISYFRYILMTLICLIMVFNTTFPALNRATQHITTVECSLESIVNTMIDCMHYTDCDSPNTSAEAVPNTLPLEEDNGSSEDELIPHASESYLAEIIHVRLHSSDAHMNNHVAPHIEFTTPPPEI